MSTTIIVIGSKDRALDAVYAQIMNAAPKSIASKVIDVEPDDE